MSAANVGTPLRARTTVVKTNEIRPSVYGPAGALVLVDSGPLLALFNRTDRWHAAVIEWMQTNPRIKLVTTWCVLTEVCATLSRR